MKRHHPDSGETPPVNNKKARADPHLDFPPPLPHGAIYTSYPDALCTLLYDEGHAQYYFPDGCARVISAAAGSLWRRKIPIMGSDAHALCQLCWIARDRKGYYREMYERLPNGDATRGLVASIVDERYLSGERPPNIWTLSLRAFLDRYALVACDDV